MYLTGNIVTEVCIHTAKILSRHLGQVELGIVPWPPLPLKYCIYTSDSISYFGSIFAARVCVTMLPSLITNVSVAYS
ncbi:MAG: hypothetical protein J07HQW1_00526 [Haloquadratum walsbyi J07HQW1]|uniref:Uncharacterized protein n=1 Tax=Haloquadratum walsbyi J07HQW1 TaxID=1238424 RepID=U1N2D1_9EURY|nr:MAG: hypothetical protein J07HQW1_00526 [Haloquadratum walsbyi J07HQW1]